jgi:hypothetical protein
MWRDVACFLRHCEFSFHSTFTWQRISSTIFRIQHRI